jgi:hypothetical protein
MAIAQILKVTTEVKDGSLPFQLVTNVTLTTRLCRR